MRYHFLYTLLALAGPFKLAYLSLATPYSITAAFSKSAGTTMDLVNTHSTQTFVLNDTLSSIKVNRSSGVGWISEYSALSRSEYLTSVPRQSLIYKPRGSRTTFSRNANGERDHIVTKASDYPMHLYPDFLTVFYYYGRLFVLTVFLDIYLLSSLRVLSRFPRTILDASFGVFTAALNFPVDALIAVFNTSISVYIRSKFRLGIGNALSIFYIVTTWLKYILDTAYIGFLGHLAAFIDKAENISNRRRIWNHTKAVVNFTCEVPPVKEIQPRTDKYWSTPLFRRENHSYIKWVFLLEEASHPIRHMYDPRYFNFVKVIGEGAFGSISQVEHRITGKMMALKTMVMEKTISEEIDNEIRTMIRIQGMKWFPRLLCSFMDRENFYLLMPIYHRGDLLSYMSTWGGFLEKSLAQFYLAELLIAVQVLHKMGIIHRDLKAQNILFSADGHLIVADFGVAHLFKPEDEEDAFFEDEYPVWVEKKRLGGDDFPFLTPSVDNPHIVVEPTGTKEFAAPEVFEGLPYSYGVDYYAIAILYHAMVTGFIPLFEEIFDSATDELQVVMDLGTKFYHHQTLSDIEVDFLTKMLDRDPYARLTVTQMKAHTVLEGIEWDKMEGREQPVPLMVNGRKKLNVFECIKRLPTASDLY